MDSEGERNFVFFFNVFEKEKGRKSERSMHSKRMAPRSMTTPFEMIQNDKTSNESIVEYIRTIPWQVLIYRSTMFGEFIYSFLFGVTLAEGWSQFQISQLVFSSMSEWNKPKKKTISDDAVFFIQVFMHWRTKCNKRGIHFKQKKKKTKTENRLSRKSTEHFKLMLFHCFVRERMNTHWNWI